MLETTQTLDDIAELHSQITTELLEHRTNSVFLEKLIPDDCYLEFQHVDEDYSTYPLESIFESITTIKWWKKERLFLVKIRLKWNFAFEIEDIVHFECNGDGCKTNIRKNQHHWCKSCHYREPGEHSKEELITIYFCDSDNVNAETEFQLTFEDIKELITNVELVDIVESHEISEKIEHAKEIKTEIQDIHEKIKLAQQELLNVSKRNGFTSDEEMFHFLESQHVFEIQKLTQDLQQFIKDH